DCLARHLGRPRWLGLRRSCRAPAASARADEVYRWLQEASGRFANAATLDFNDLVCPAGYCDAERDGMIVFLDAQHMTATFAASLAPAMRRRLALADAPAAAAQAGGISSAPAACLGAGSRPAPASRAVPAAARAGSAAPCPAAGAA